MPIWRRKRVQLTQPSQGLLDCAQRDPNKQIFYLSKTGEIFEDYESYCARLTFYRTKQFQCEVTGKGGLDYFQAIDNELHEGKTLHARFPEALKAAVLRSVQWQIIGRLDNLVEAVYERYKDRYFADENVLLDVGGDRFWARVVDIFPPKHAQLSAHRTGGDLGLTLKESIEQDDPQGYFYKVQIQDETATPNTLYSNGNSSSSSNNHRKGGNGGVKWGGSIMDVKCTVLSRDRLAFSKSILRRFLRDTIDRNASATSPWIVKSSIANKYGLETAMPEGLAKDAESMGKDGKEKRKKGFGQKEGPVLKKQKKGLDGDDGHKSSPQKGKGEDDAANSTIGEKEMALEPKKKKPLKYPAEDLDIQPTEKEKKNGIKVRPPPRRDVPFGSAFESFLMTWSYLQVFGIPLNLSPFTMDELEQAIKHSSDSPCFLIAEIHSRLVYNIRQLPKQHNIAISSLFELKQEMVRGSITDEGDITIDDLIQVLSEKGGSWERSPLQSTGPREGWQDAVIGLLKDHATIPTFPRLREVLTALLFAINADSSSTPDPYEHNSFSTIAYNRMPSEDKIALLSFLCDCSISTKSVRGYMEGCEEQLTQLRKEKMELNRERKKCIEHMNELVEKDIQKEPEANVDGSGLSEDHSDSTPNAPSMNSEEVDKRSSSDYIGSDSEHQNARRTPNGTSKNVKGLQVKTHSHALQRQLERERLAKSKAALAEHRRLDEEVNKLDRRLEFLELEFRKLLGVARAKPMGKDRFYSRLWWLDGQGGATLTGQGGTILYGAGRVFIQGPNASDWEALERREVDENDVMIRMREELGEEGVMDIDEWGYYADAEEIEQFLSWLNHKGKRELQLKNALTPWQHHILAGVRKRHSDFITPTNNSMARPGESRRNSRQPITVDKGHSSKESYLAWSNRRAPHSQTAPDS